MALATFIKPKVTASASSLPAHWYTSADVVALERERIFTREWLCVGREEKLPRPGDFFLAEIAGESVIVVRGVDGRIRAFFNVCRHRSTRMCLQAAGHFSGSIQCPYHAWTYGLDGTLLAARNMTQVDGFERSDYPLHQAAVALFEGFLFVNLARDPISFERQFAALIGRFSQWDIGTLREARTIAYDLACNWKLVFQNYSECYHCPLVHPQLDKLSASDSGRNDLHKGAFLGGFSELRAHGASLTTSGATTRPPLGEVGGADLDRVYYYTIFPSMLLSLHRDYVMVHYVKPLGADRTQVECSWLFDQKTMKTPGFDCSDAVDFWDLTNRQDWKVNELTHLGLTSRVSTPGRYSNAEALLRAFDEHYLQIMKAKE